MFQIQPDVTDELILQNISQEEIFEYYLNTRVVFNEFICSPLRRDKNPTCTFKWLGNKLYFRDWSESRPKDCFNIVQELYNCDFHQSLLIIKRDLLDGKKLNVPKTVKQFSKQTFKSSKKRIRCKLQPFTDVDLKYLTKYGLTSKQTSTFNVFSIERLWIDGKQTYSYRDSDPAIGYYFGKTEDGQQRWKIYFYTRDTYRFMCNTNRINGWVQLPDNGDQLVITKSLKDVMCLHALGVNAIAMQNETTIPYDYIINELNDRFDKLYSFYDFDYTGVLNANKLKRLYKIPYIFLTNGKLNTKNYHAKDISDFIMEYNIDKAKQFLNQCGVNC